MIETRPMLPEQWQLYKSVRCAALEDAPYAFSSTLEDALKRSDQEWQQLTRRYASHPNSLTFFAFDKDHVCGMAACVISGEKVEIFSVWVEPGCRGKGVGRTLIDFGREWSLSKGAAQLRVGIFEDNLGAQAFYRSLGFIDSNQVDPVLSSEKRSVLLFTLHLQ